MKVAWMCPLDRDQPELALEEALAAEEAGFDGVLVPDPFHPWTDEGAAGFVWSWLGAVAARTSQIQLIVAATSPCTRYHPAVVAQAAATVSRLSGGRLTLGLGVGDPLHHLPFAIPVERYAKRRQDLVDAIAIIQSLIGGEVVTAGDPFPLRQARLYSPPLQPLRLALAASGSKTATLAADSRVRPHHEYPGPSANECRCH